MTKPSGGDALGAERIYVRNRDRKEAFKSFLESMFWLESLARPNIENKADLESVVPLRVT